MTDRRGGPDEFANSDQAPSNEFLNFAALLRRRKWLILTVTAVTVGLALFVTLREARVYAASAVIQVGSNSADSSGQTDKITAAHNRAVSTVAIVTSEGYRQVAAKALGIGAGTLRQVSAAPITDTDLIRLRSTGASPEEARRLAQDYAQYIVQQAQSAIDESTAHQASLLQKQYDVLTGRIDDLQAQQARADRAGDNVTVDQLRVSIGALRDQQASLTTQIALAGPSTVTDLVTLRTVSPATASSAPVSPRVGFTVAIALVVGLLLGLLLAWVQDQLDRTMRSIGEVEQRTGRPVLALVPLVRQSDALNAPAAADAYSFLRVNLGVALGGAGHRVLAMTSTQEGEGKTTSVIGLGRSFAGAGRRVLLVDADLRRRGLSRALECDARPGLTEFLQGTAELDGLMIKVGNLTVLPAGAGVNQNTAALLDSARFEWLFETVREEYDNVIVDTTPARMRADAVLVAAVADAVLLVARLGIVDRDEFSSTVTALQGRGSELIGCVVYAQDDSSSYEYVSLPTHKHWWSRVLAGGRAGQR